MDCLVCGASRPQAEGRRSYQTVASLEPVKCLQGFSSQLCPPPQEAPGNEAPSLPDHMLFAGLSSYDI